MITIESDQTDAISQSIDIILNGGVIVYPTDTIYGFGVDASNESAIEKLNTIKKRHSPISVLTDSLETAISWIKNDKDIKIISDNLTGAATIIFQINNNIVSNKILGDDGSLGVRLPDHSFCNELAKKCPTIITTTSVNRHGVPPLNEPRTIEKEFEQDIDLLIDGGDLSGNSGSRIYKIESGKLITIR